MLLKIALNGARPKSENEFIPKSLDEIEKEVRLLYQNDCKVFHIHCYDQQGKESLKPDDVYNLIMRVKTISPDIMLGISSGDWIEPDYDKRIYYIKSWKLVPDFISVNFIEDNAVDIAKLMIEKGILIEAGLNEEKAAEIFFKSNLSEYCCRILIEAEDSSVNTVNGIENIIKANKSELNILLHGYNESAWNLLREAKKRGYDSRIGMEDTIYLEDGTKVKSNLELLNYARKIINE